VSKFLGRGARGSCAPDRRNKSLEEWHSEATADNGYDWKRVARERVEDDRLKLRGGGSAGHSCPVAATDFENTCDLVTRRAFSRREGEELCFTESSRHSTGAFRTRPFQNPRTLFSISTPRELRIDRRVRADPADASSPALVLHNGDSAARWSYVRRQPRSRSRLAGTRQGTCKAIWHSLFTLSEKFSGK